MEKLIQLLNEYEEKYNRSDLYYKFELENWILFCYDDVTDYLWTMQDEAMVICSKKYWFIKWLVDNDKIDFDKVYEKEKSEKVDICIYWKIALEEKTDWLLMLLSIQDNSIEFLISILR